MKLENIPFSVGDWSKLSPIGVRGETGKAVSRELDQGEVRIRIVEYSPDYRSGDWCGKGHIALVIEGELTVELEDGSKYHLKEDMSMQVGDNVVRHKVSSRNGARVVIFD